MAQRLATEYVQTCLRMSQAEMSKLIRMFSEHQIMFQVKILENGAQEFVIEDVQGQEISLTFQQKNALEYEFRGSCRIENPKIVQFMRNMVATFKGDAVVNRIYAYHTMKYTYKKGKVIQILESTDNQEKLIYEFQNSLEILERMFYRTKVEYEIQQMYHSIDQFLDARIKTHDPIELKQIDHELQRLSYQLFILEA